jgi:hypothetical protein
MFGSDWPYIDRHYVEEQNANLLNLRDREFGAELFAKIERGNAAALFPRFR